LIIPSPSDNQVSESRRLESRAALAAGMCMTIAFGAHFMYLGDVSELQNLVLGISGLFLFPGFLVLPGAYFGPLPGFIVSLWLWVVIARKAVRKWVARNSRSFGA
jgi:hypothetical protein